MFHPNKELSLNLKCTSYFHCAKKYTGSYWVKITNLFLSESLKPSFLVHVECYTLLKKYGCGKITSADVTFSSQ